MCVCMYIYIYIYIPAAIKGKLYTLFYLLANQLWKEVVCECVCMYVYIYIYILMILNTQPTVCEYIYVYIYI